jgi:spermidine/putrescine transport system substrate-binding protein
LIGAALKYLGYSLNDTDEAHLQEAKDLILKAKPFFKTFNSEDPDISLMIPGEVVISHSWSGQASQAIAETTDPATGESKWAYVIPKEGGMRWQDNMCITAASQRKATAEHFINFMLEPESGAALTKITYYSSPNKAAKELLPPEIVNNRAIFPTEDMLKNLEWAQSLGETIFVYDRLWTEIKSQ